MNDSSISEHPVTYKQMLAFFLPLGFSSTLVTVSHVIINSTLARSPNPEFIISTYAIALSLYSLTERPGILLRQTCSTLVRDRNSFRAMTSISNYVLACIMLLNTIIAYTPLGAVVFRHFFGVEEAALEPTLGVYRILMFVSIFSGIRCLYHGIIIYNMRTKWLTIGMVIRLAAMYGLSLYFIRTGVNSGKAGAIIFLSGMAIECLVAWLEGRNLLRHSIPDKVEGHVITNRSHIFKFYKPLLYSSFIAVLIGPSINAMLGKTAEQQLAVASFALASSINLLVLSFFTYLHQIVLNFYAKDSRKVKRFAFTLAFLPGLLTALLSFTPIGPWILTQVMGANEELMRASLDTLRVLMLYSFIFPWIDYGNGIIMMRGQTKMMMRSQMGNVVLTIATLILCVWMTPGWNGTIGALAQSLGVAAELTIVMIVVNSGNTPVRPARDKGASL